MKQYKVTEVSINGTHSDNIDVGVFNSLQEAINGRLNYLIKRSAEVIEDAKHDNLSTDEVLADLFQLENHIDIDEL